MKKYLLLAVSFVCMSALHAQTYDENEKEALRKVLRLEKYENDLFTGASVNKKNFELFGLTEADTLSWYASEEWVAKLTSFTWNEDSPKRMKGMSITKGLSDIYYDLSPFTELESLYCGIFRSPISIRGCSFDISKNKKLKSLSVTGSGFSSDSFNEENNIDSLWMIQSTIPDLKMFPKLKYFTSGASSASGDRILDFSNSPLLESLNFVNYNMRYNGVAGINVKNNKSLKTLSFANVLGVKTLDLSGNTALEDVYINDVNLKEIIFPNAPNLRKLRMSSIFPRGEEDEMMKNLVLEPLNLDTLYIKTCYSLENIDVSHMTNLKHFECNSNHILESLDLSDCVNLEYLDCSDNRLTSLLFPENNNIKTLICSKNGLKFSGLPLKSFQEFKYSGQSDYIKVYWKDGIDLSNEYIIDGYTTNYQWKLSNNSYNGTSVLLSGTNGKFEITEDMIGKYLDCFMTNERFPDLTIYISFYLLRDGLGIQEDTVHNQSIHLQSSIVSRYEPIILESTSGFSGVAYLYNAWGQTVAGKSKVVSGTTEIPAPMSSGVYLLNVNMDNGSNYTFKILVR